MPLVSLMDNSPKAKGSMARKTIQEKARKYYYTFMS